MEDNQLIDQVSPQHNGTQIDLPSSGGTLAMGIASIFLFGIIGVILAIMTRSRTKEALHSYNLNPGRYTTSSYKRIKAARICATVSLSLLLGSIVILMVVSSMQGHRPV